MDESDFLVGWKIVEICGEIHFESEERRMRF
jgi:hypothetical protein